MRFGMLGPLQVLLEDREVPVRAAKQRVLLAALLLTPGQPVSSARLCELVWDGRPPPRSAVTLRSYVMRLRQVLGPAGGSRIVTAGRGYLIEAAKDEVDLLRYEAMCGMGEAALHSSAWEQAAELLTQAESLWRGNPLADIPCQELQISEVPRLEQLRLQAIQGRIQADLHTGHCGKVVPELQALTAEHPLREPFHYQLMAALYRCGRRADALAAYRQARSVLVNELGIEPAPDLRLLHQRILSGDPEPAVASGQVWPAVSAQRRPSPRQLPPPVPNFVGRAAELQELTGLLKAWTAARGATMIAVIGGTAGVGKTALAVHWAHQVADSFPDGQLYLNLNGFGPAGSPMTQAGAVSRILEAIQVPLARIPSSLEGRVGLYRTLLSERRTLIVLDNAKDAEQVRPLLPGGAGSLVLVTSRSPLTGLVALEGARAITLDVLTEPEARQMVAQRLEIGRTAADRAATDQLIETCARLPLALAIATALVATRPGQSLTAVTSNLRRADNRLDVLNTGEATTNLRTVFYWSYLALTSAAARMFRLLAEHPGPDISVAAAASLTGLSSTRASKTLTELTDSHLINEHTHGRFAFHDLLRLYAAEMLNTLDSAAERHAAGQRMLDHYLHTARAAAQAISPTRALLDLAPAVPGANPEELADQDQAIAWLKAEHQVLMRAIGYAADTGSDVHAWQLPWALTDFLDRGGNWSDFAASQRTALAAARRLRDVAAQAHAHRYIGRACFQLQDFDDALDHLTRALELRRQLGEPTGEAGGCLDLCNVHEQRGELGQALGFAQRALGLYRSAQHRVGEAHALNSVGWYHALRRDYPEALSHCDQALELCIQLGYKLAEGHTWHSLGFVHQHMGQSARAISCYGRALDIYRQLMDRYHESRVLTDLGDARRAAGDLPAARRAWRDALAILDDLDHPDGDQLRTKITGTGTAGPARELSSAHPEGAAPLS
jgi:DNA-binding SARP family transcriptional activator/tetratricopeptide (TPR) repeat protein